MSLSGKKVILGITGSIAAYKSALITRTLIKEGAEVQVIMTHHAKDFISPLTLSTLSKREVMSDMFTNDHWNNHVDLGLWADMMVIAPCTANTMAALAHGACTNMLQAVYLSARCPVHIAPAMDVDMWHHPATQRNLKLLQEDGINIIPVGVGELASGLHGEGRMAEVEDIIAHLAKTGSAQDLEGKSALVTAGPTYESIDPVRFIGNWSTGKMGIAIAHSLASRGAKVQLVLGPTTEEIHHPMIDVSHVVSADDMLEACKPHFGQVDFAIFAAAVADYKPTQVSQKKIKKSDDHLQLQLKRTQDLAAHFGQIKKDNQIAIGFALETHNNPEQVKEKMIRKNFDAIVFNSLEEHGAGFGHDTNKVAIIDQNDIKHFPLQSKQEVAGIIVERLVQLLKTKH